jgi:predicted metal-dependent peptidase
MSYLTPEERVKKNHIALMRHPETALYSGIMMAGETHVSDEAFTAYTDGLNKKYSAKFMEKLSDEELRAVILHENLHVALMHIPRHKDLMRENSMLANVAMDIVVNNIINRLSDKKLCKLPEGGIWDAKYDGWSVREIYNDLKKQNPPRPGDGGQSRTQPDESGQSRTQPDGSGQGKGEVIVNGKTFSTDDSDEHDASGAEGKTPEQLKELEEHVNRALREGGMLAGRLGTKVPREIEQSLVSPVDWRKELQDYIKTSVRGADELTWRKFNRSLLANDILAPSVESETITEVVFAVDTSGSISSADLAAVATQIAAACETCRPEKVRVLWWDTHVHGEQVFTDDYDNIRSLLKPQGGGGTQVSCVSEYIIKNKLTPDCMVILTDGYLEDNIQWSTTVDTLWLVKGNNRFVPPSGKKLTIEGE